MLQPPKSAWRLAAGIGRHVIGRANMQCMMLLSLVYTGSVVQRVALWPMLVFLRQCMPHGESCPRRVLIGSQRRDADRDALMAVFVATGSLSVLRDGNWATSSSLRDWEGVSVDESGRVVTLYLHQVVRSGSLSYLVLQFCPVSS